MPNLDDHYRKVAAANTAPVSAKDMRPNGESFVSRTFGARGLANKLADDREYAGTMPKGYRDRMTRDLPCTTCGAKPGSPCISQARDRMGAELPGFHTSRSIEAQRNYRK